MVASWQESYDKTRQYVKKQRYHFGDKGPYNQIYGISSSHPEVFTQCDVPSSENVWLIN